VKPLLPTGAVTRNPDFTDHRRILEHVPPADLELSMYEGWGEEVIGDLQGLPIVTAHADKAIGATLSGDHPALKRFALNCRIASALGARTLVFHLGSFRTATGTSSGISTTSPGSSTPRRSTA
jgi:hypothetical protein